MIEMQNELLKKYFLGLLNPTDSEQVELRIFEDDAFEEELIQAEQNLIEDYLNASLTNQEIIAFNHNYLSTKERRYQVEFIRLLKNYSQKKPIVEEKKGFFEQLKTFINRPKLAFGFAALVLVVLLGVSLLIFNGSQNSEIVSLNQQDLSNLAEFKNLRTINLTSENLRSTDKLNFLPQPELTDKVLLRLAIPATPPSEQTFSVSIWRDGNMIQTLSQRSYQNQEVRLLLPKSILTKGEYRITLTKDSEKYNYYFVIQ